MNEEAEHEAIEEGEAADVSPSNGHIEDDNVIEALRARRNRIGEDKETLIDLPGYNGDYGLVGNYRRMSYDELKKIGDRARRSKHPNPAFMSEVDTIASALIEMYVRVPVEGGEDKVIPLRDVVPGRTEPIRYDQSLGDFLGFDCDGSARKAVLATFNNDLAVSPHHSELVVWMQLSLKDEEEVFTES